MRGFYGLGLNGGEGGLGFKLCAQARFSAKTSAAALLTIETDLSMAYYLVNQPRLLGITCATNVMPLTV
jgi:hypothetical protein